MSLCSQRKSTQVKKREDSKGAAAAGAAAGVVQAKTEVARTWEECVDEGEAFVTAMLASVVRSLAEGPKTETELDQVDTHTSSLFFVHWGFFVVVFVAQEYHNFLSCPHLVLILLVGR